MGHYKSHTYHFQGESPSSSSPVTVFLRKGKYFFELYGASGGGKNCGKGGYTSGIFQAIKDINFIYILADKVLPMSRM